jgi:hypothetical protein
MLLENTYNVGITHGDPKMVIVQATGVTIGTRIEKTGLGISQVTFREAPDCNYQTRLKKKLAKDT